MHYERENRLVWASEWPLGPASADSLFQLTVLFHNLLSLECDQQKKEKERNRSSLYVRTRTLDHVLFSFGSPRERRMTAGSKWVLMDELKRFQMPKACVSNLLVQELMTRVSSLTGHFSHLLTHLFFFNLCVKREKNVDRLVENAKRQDRKPLQRRSLSQRFLFSCVRSQAHWLSSQHKKRMKAIVFRRALWCHRFHQRTDHGSHSFF